MSQAYAEIAKKSIHNEEDENMHADLQIHLNGHNGIHHGLDANENFEATVSRNKSDANTDSHRSNTGQSSVDRSSDVGSSSDVTGKPENQQQRSSNKKSTSRGIGKDRSRKVGKGKVALGVAVDIVIAGLVVSWIVKKPSVNKAHVGLGTIGLGLFYGVQWTIYKKLMAN